MLYIHFMFKDQLQTLFHIHLSPKFILQNNNMKFNNELYNEIKGIAMGTIFAPTYATL